VWVTLRVGLFWCGECGVVLGVSCFRSGEGDGMVNEIKALYCSGARGVAWLGFYWYFRRICDSAFDMGCSREYEYVPQSNRTGLASSIRQHNCAMQCPRHSASSADTQNQMP
jgi:hypothetical protein